MRKFFGDWLIERVKEDQTIYLIVGDTGYKSFDNFKRLYPDRYINIGICEQSMISIAAGMALNGLKPYVYTITPFLIERALEQIKIDINLNNANVKLIGFDDYPTQGPTHKCADDHIVKMFSNIKCFYPMDINQLKNSLDKTYNNKKPTFINMRKI